MERDKPTKIMGKWREESQKVWKLKMSVTLSRVKCQSCDKVLPVTPWSRIQLLEASIFSSLLEEDVGGLFIKVRWRSWGGDRKTVVTLRTAWHCTLSCTGGLVNDAYMIFFYLQITKKGKRCKWAMDLSWHDNNFCCWHFKVVKFTIMNVNQKLESKYLSSVKQIFILLSDFLSNFVDFIVTFLLAPLVWRWSWRIYGRTAWHYQIILVADENLS